MRCGESRDGQIRTLLQDKIEYKIQGIAICWGESNSTFPETGEKERKESKKVCGNVGDDVRIETSRGSFSLLHKLS